MGQLDIIKSTLSSRAVRQTVGQRIVRPIQTKEGDAGNSIINWIWNGAKRLGGFLLSAIGKAFSVSWTTLWSLFTSAAVFLFNFNWNATDEELNAGIQAQWTAIAGQFGGVVGNALGYLGCGFIPTAVVWRFNEQLGRHLLSKLGEEFLDEFVGNLAALSKTVFTTGMQTILTWSYQNVRKWIKSNSEWFGKIFGDKTKKAIDAWGAKGSKPWSFAIKLEELVEKIPNEALRNFVEEALEEAWEGCVEAGYVLANAADTYQPQKMLEDETNPPWGNNVTVKITPNRSISDEYVILQAPEPVLRGQIVNYLSQDQMLREKDVGQIYAAPMSIPDRSLHPEIVLYFYQLKADRITGQTPVKLECSFRMMKWERSDPGLAAELQRIAQIIYTKFAQPPFFIQKGPQLWLYADWAKGYDFYVYAQDQANAQKLIEQVLDIQGHSVDLDKLKPKSKPVSGDLTPEDTEVILGNTVKAEPRGRAGKVSFQRAYCRAGRGVVQELVDLAGKRPTAYFRA